MASSETFSSFIIRWMSDTVSDTSLRLMRFDGSTLTSASSTSSSKDRAEWALFLERRRAMVRTFPSSIPSMSCSRLSRTSICSWNAVSTADLRAPALMVTPFTPDMNSRMRPICSLYAVSPTVERIPAMAASMSSAESRRSAIMASISLSSTFDDPLSMASQSARESLTRLSASSSIALQAPANSSVAVS